MPFIKPPFFQARPAASRGLGSGEGPTPPAEGTFITFDPTIGAGSMWFDVTLPPTYGLGDGFSVEIVSRFLNVDATVVGQLNTHGNTYNGGSFINVNAGIFLNTGDVSISYDDPLHNEVTVPTTVQTSTMRVPGTNYGSTVGGPPFAGGMTVLPLVVYDNFHNVINQGGHTTYLSDASNPPINFWSLTGAAIGFGLVAPTDVFIGDFGLPPQDGGGIPNGTVQYAAGDTVSVIVFFSYHDGQPGTDRGLISEVRTVIDGVRTVVPFGDILGGFGSGEPGAYHPAHVLNFAYPGGAPYEEMYLIHYAPPVPPAPVNVTAPVIVGVPIEGNTLTLTSRGVWSNDPTAFAYQWMANATEIPGATGTEWVVDATLYNGRQARCRVTATNAGGATVALSNAKGPISQPSKRRVTATGQIRLTFGGLTRITK